MKVSKDCGYNTYSANNTCWSSATGYSIITADGTGMRINEFLIDVDIDGPNKGKQKEGYDIFSFVLTKDGLMPSGETNPLNCFSETWGINSLCTAWVIQNDNMDYLLADAKTGKCLNSDVTLSLTETSCK